MANEIRLRANNISGTTTDNPLTAGATTINSPGFVDLPVVNTTNHLILILDPLETAGAAEIVQVTSHAASSPSVTVVRGFDTTTPRQHNLGTTWFHGPVVSDYNFTQRTALSTNRPAAPINGELIYETDTDRWVARSSGGVWLPAPFNPPSVRAFHSATQSIAHAVETTLAFNSETYDSDSMHDNATNNSRLTINTAGLYLFTANIPLDRSTDYTHSYCKIIFNGSTLNSLATTSDGTSVSAADADMFHNPVGFRRCIIGDFIQVVVFHRNGAATARNVNPDGGGRSMCSSAIWMGP